MEFLTGHSLAEGAALAAVGVVGSALSAGLEMGVYCVNRVRLNVRARAPIESGVGRTDRAAQILHDELEHAPRVLAALLVAYNVCGYLFSLGLTTILHGVGWSDSSILLLNALAVAPGLFVVADSLPKEVFRARADPLTYLFARPLRWLRLAMTYTMILPLVQGAARLTADLFPGSDESTVLSVRERIAVLLKEGASHGVISESQVTLLDRALALRETTVGDEMMPWTRCYRLSSDWGRGQMLDYIARFPRSRFPVVDLAARGRVLGVIHALDLCLEPDKPLSEFMQPVVTLDQELPVREGLVRLKSAGASLAIVSSGGRPVGIVTAKDLVEPLTGELSAY